MYTHICVYLSIYLDLHLYLYLYRGFILIACPVETYAPPSVLSCATSACPASVSWYCSCYDDGND